ncbi:MAG TPA: MlrC C-terminal domain-containing protein, partial [Thermoflexales bacterium]|nr:MlrC C-terminal domain-containing protein [Thermoflexales bacterium]
QLCQAAGVGGTLRARLGGKMGPSSGDPLDVVASVRGLKSNLVQRWPQLQGALMMPCGDAAWLEIAGIDVIVNSLRTQVFSPDVFSAFGIPYHLRRLLVVKSSQHFYAGFEPVAARILYASTPGTLNYDFAQVPYQRLDRARFPVLN